MNVTREQLRRILALLQNTTVYEIDCGEVLDRVGAFLETVRSGAALPRDLVDVARHLELCHECFEEFEALQAACDSLDED